MNKRSSTLPNSNQLSSNQSGNRHNVLGESFALPNMSWVKFNSDFQFTPLDILNSTRNSLGASPTVGHKKGVTHV